MSETSFCSWLKNDLKKKLRWKFLPINKMVIFDDKLSEFCSARHMKLSLTIFTDCNVIIVALAIVARSDKNVTVSDIKNKSKFCGPPKEISAWFKYGSNCWQYLSHIF